MGIFEIIFWVSFFFLFYTYWGYPFLLWFLNQITPHLPHKDNFFPDVSILFVAYNEEKNIERKLKNLLELEYMGKLEIIAGSDGSSDKTNEILKQYESLGIKTFFSPERAGKVNVLKYLVPMASADFIVFCDTRQIFDKQAITNLMADFADPEVGCVSGELLFYKENVTLVGEGVGAYWRYEKWIRRMESSFCSTVGATGALYAIRKKLFVAPPADILLDDVYIPLKVVEQGFRVLFEPESLVFDKVAESSAEELRRKVRTLAGNFQLFFHYREFLNPFKNRIAWQFFSHKLLRAFAFIFLISAFVSNAMLAGIGFYFCCFVFQVFFYLMAVAGFILKGTKVKTGLLSFPYAFCILNFSSLMGLIHFISKKQKVTWAKKD